MGAGLGVVQLHGEEHDVDRSDRRRIVGRVDVGQVQIAFEAANRQATGAQRVEVSAARDEADVGAGSGETAAEVAADGAGADNRHAK